jgi:hypothetical protein
MANHYGGGYSLKRSWKTFDELPRSAREALANSVEDWAAQPLLKLHVRRGLNAKQLVAKVADWDRKELAKREDQRSRAIGPYRGNVRDADLAGKIKR